jgi:hypothetical protein
MKKLKNLVTFLDFDHNTWHQKAAEAPQEPAEFEEVDFVANEDQRLNQAFSNALGNKSKSKSKSNMFDDDDELEQKQKGKSSKSNIFDKEKKSNGLKDRVNSVKKDVLRTFWKGYKQEVSPFWQKAHKYVFNKEV